MPWRLQVNLGFATSISRPPDADGSIMGKDEPATLPRVSRLVLISRLSPWCTIINRETGVTIADVCSTIFKEYASSHQSSFTSADKFSSRYTEHDITEAEFSKLNPRSQDQLRRSAASNLQASQPPTQPWGYYTPAAQPERLRRVGMCPYPFCFSQNLYHFNVFFFLCRLAARESIL